MSLNKSKVAIAASAFMAAALMSGGAQAQQKQLTLCWAAWDPANALVELTSGLRARREEISKDSASVNAKVKEMSEKARSMAAETLKEVRSIIGLPKRI